MPGRSARSSRRNCISVRNNSGSGRDDCGGGSDFGGGGASGALGGCGDGASLCRTSSATRAGASSCTNVRARLDRSSRACGNVSRAARQSEIGKNRSRIPHTPISTGPPERRQQPSAAPSVCSGEMPRRTLIRSRRIPRGREAGRPRFSRARPAAARRSAGQARTPARRPPRPQPGDRRRRRDRARDPPRAPSPPA